MKRHLGSAFKAAAWAYLVLLHLGLAYLFLSPEGRARVYWRFPPSNHETPLWRETVAAHARLDATLSPGSAVFIGDSGVQSLNVGAVAPHSVNYGIGSDTIAGVRHRLPRYRSLPAARAIVLLIGSNDLAMRPVEAVAADYAGLVASLPAAPRLVLVAVLPIDERSVAAGRRSNQAITELNRTIEGICAKRPSCDMVDAGPMLRDAAGQLRPDLHIGDGLHLNAAGYRILIAGLAAALDRPRAGR